MYVCARACVRVLCVCMRGYVYVLELGSNIRSNLG